MSVWEEPSSKKILINGKLSLTYHGNNEMLIFVYSRQFCDHFCWYMSIFFDFRLTFVNLSSSFCRLTSGFVDFHLIFIDSWIVLVYLFDLCRLLYTFLDFSCVWPMFVGFLSTSADFVHLFFDCSYFWLVFVDFQGSSDCNLFLL